MRNGRRNKFKRNLHGFASYFETENVNFSFVMVVSCFFQREREKEREFVYYHKHKNDGRNVNEVKFIISSNFLIHISITGKCHKITIKEMNSSFFFFSNENERMYFIISFWKIMKRRYCNTYTNEKRICNCLFKLFSYKIFVT